MKSRNQAIDYIKACMAILILLYHYTTRYAEMLNVEPFHFRITNGGTIGVAIFFVISSIYGIRSLEKNKEIKLIPYMLKKVKRLWPAYIVAITFTFTVTTLYPIEGLTVKWSDFFINIFMIQRFIGSAAVDGAHWYIAFLLVMYFWIGVFKKIGIEKKFYIYLIWLGASTIFSSEFFAGLGITQTSIINSKFNAIMNTLLLERYTAYIVAGVMIYFLAEGIGKKWQNYMVLTLCGVRNCVIIGSYTLLIITALSFLVYFAYIGRIKVKNIKVLAYISEISYALYLIHQNIGYVILDIMASKGLTKEIYIIIPAIISILLATLITFAFEKPIHKFLSKKIC